MSILTNFFCSFTGEYNLPQGVFLFLGYSETDEALLKPHSNLTVQDVVLALQEFIAEQVSLSLKPEIPYRL